MYDYPAKNRPVDNGGLEGVDIDITSGTGTQRLDPNGLIAATFTGKLDKLVPIEGVQSDISGAPAVRYRSAEVLLHLTPEELKRLVTRCLEPAEFFALFNKYGEFFEVHSDFYNFETGKALQRME